MPEPHEGVGLDGQDVEWDAADSDLDDESLTPEGLEQLLEGRLRSPEEACLHEFTPPETRATGEPDDKPVRGRRRRR